MEFLCHNPAAKYACDQIWKGNVKNLFRNGSILEADVEGKGSALHIIVGTYQYGKFPKQVPISSANSNCDMLFFAFLLKSFNLCPIISGSHL